MIAYAGMSDKLSNLCYYNNNEYSFNRPYSEKTAETIDNEVHAMINEQYERAKELLREHKEGHAELAKILMEREVIFAEDVEKIFGKRPWASRSEEIFADNKTADENITEETQPAETAENKENISEETATA
jgi:cell division protease FtsH